MPAIAMASVYRNVSKSCAESTSVPSKGVGMLSKRIVQARKALAVCNFCEFRCGADRTQGLGQPCGLGTTSRCYKHHMSLAEELELLPSYMVYFAGCNFRCRFCVQAPYSIDAHAGRPIAPAELAAVAAQAMLKGAKTINLVGGEPSLHVHTILEAAAVSARPLPLVLNSNMYMTPVVLEWLEGVVKLYLADFKYGNDACAERLSGAKNYFQIVTRNLLLAARSGRVLVRHLLLPGHLECCFLPISKWMAEHLPQSPFHVMFSYVQGPKTMQEGELGRLVNGDEIATAKRWLRDLGIPEYEQETA